MSSDADMQAAPQGVLISNTSVSTGSLPTRPPSHPSPPTHGSDDPSGRHPDPPTPRTLPTPIRPSAVGPQDVALIVLAALASFCLVWVVFYQLTFLTGGLGFLVCWYAGFLALTWLGTSQVIERQVATDRVVGILVWSAGLLIVGIVVFIVAWVTYKAVPSIHWSALFTKDQKTLTASDPNLLNHVGVLQAIVGTLEQVLMATLMGVPFAIATAVYLNEVGTGRTARLVRTVVTAMSGTPSIVAGVFIYSIFIFTGVLHYSGFAASLALVVILLPSVTRVVEEVLRVVPSGLREASFSLGAPEWRTVWSVVIPTARSGVVTAVLLGVARIVGETAPLIFTAFGSQVLNANPLVHDQGALPLVILSNTHAAQQVLINIAFQAAFVLMSIVLILFVLARYFSRTKSKKSGRAPTTEDDTLARIFLPIPIESAPE